MSKKEERPKLIVSNPFEGTSKSVLLTPEQLQMFLGKKIGDEVDASFVGFKGYKLRITGGTDRDGFPMRPDIAGARRVRALLSGGVGYKPREKPPSKRKKKRSRRMVKGKRERVTIRGNTISPEIIQINTMLVGG